MIGEPEQGHEVVGSEVSISKTRGVMVLLVRGCSELGASVLRLAAWVGRAALRLPNANANAMGPNANATGERDDEER